MSRHVHQPESFSDTCRLAGRDRGERIRATADALVAL